jgi:hypothetical protein
MSGKKVDYLWKNSLLGRKVTVLLIVLLSGCGRAGVASSPILPSSMTSPSQAFTIIPPSRTFTSSPSSTEILPSRTATQTDSPWPTRTFSVTPTFPLTPTRGLPPSATFSPKEECPPPTFAKVNIQFAQDVRDYGPQILEYIRANGDRAELDRQIEKLGRNIEETDDTTGEKKVVFVPDSIAFTEADVTGDQIKETIITIKQSENWLGYVEMGIFVVGCRDHQFALLHSLHPNGLGFYFIHTVEKFSRIVDIRDLNANGILEIVISGGFSPAQGEVFISTYIFEWNGTDFRSLIYPIVEDPFTWGNRSLNRLPEFKDMDGNGTTELLLPWYKTHGFCSDDLITPAKGVYMWDGEYYRYMWLDPGDPIYRFQAAFYADDYTTIALYDRSEAMYRRTINDSSLKPFYSQEWGKKNNRYACDGKSTEPDEPQRIIAYSRFRLLELLVYLQKMDAAESDWEYIVANYPESSVGYQYASLANTFWEAYQKGNNIGDACATVQDETYKDSDSILGPLKYGEGLIHGPTLETICPFTDHPGG